MPSPYQFNSDWDYYDSITDGVTKEVERILEEDPIEFLKERNLLENFIQVYFDPLMEFAEQKGYLEEYIYSYLKSTGYDKEEG